MFAEKSWLIVCIWRIRDNMWSYVASIAYLSQRIRSPLKHTPTCVWHGSPGSYAGTAVLAVR